ncbi:MAG: S9 family peptidase [Betaproteobacteria bacterium]|nr:MAG: S9 family peptidase [Betaproteobacteria bacterium]
MKKLALLFAFAAVAVAAQPNSDDGALPPNPNLVVQDIPPIPRSLVQQVEKYTDFRGHGFVDWHPTRREMLVAHRKAGGNTAQLFRVTAPMAEPEQLTDFADPVTSATYEPRDGRYIVFERSSGGNEADQLYRLDLATKQVTLLTNPNERHDLQGWLHRSSRLLTSSVPLDKTAQGGSRERVTQTLRLIDPANPQRKRQLVELPGTGWFVGGVSWDDKRIALGRYISANESQLWLLDIASGKTRQVLPAPGSTERAVFLPSGFKRDNSGIFLLCDRDGEFHQLMFYRFATQRMTPITQHIPWDVGASSSSEDGRLLALHANVDGRDELRLFDARSFKELAAPKLPIGSIGTTQFHRRLAELAFSINGPHGPSLIHTLNPKTGDVEQWTKPFAPVGVDTAQFSEPQIIRWKSFDGRTISGLLNLPPARFAGKRPVLIAIHGGPEAQAKVGFLQRNNYYIDELGIAILQPNVRGSSGYGKTFLALDNGMKREDSVKDIGALLDWIAAQPNLDASRVLVTGGSYGGYMSLAVATNYADRIAGNIDVVGISNFVTFLQNTESYRRDLRRVEYGDERDPAMREFLQQISPLTNASKITKPMLVVQGKNDPRVPYTEAEQIVAKARENKTPVWYLRAENEGHGFARKENADFQFYATVLFIRSTLLKP